jgi:hypothetical protein
MSTFSTSAMLVSLNISSYSAKREDKKISADVAKQHNTTTDAGRYSKQLIAKEKLEPVTKAVSAMRTFHYANTLPWLDDGARILPAGNYETYKGEMRNLRDAYESAVRDFCDSWPAIVADARQRLNGMFDEQDYPRDPSARFSCRVKFMPISDAGDFRCAIADSERDALRHEIADTMREASEQAMRDLYQRVADTVAHMADRLRAYTVTGGKASNPFRDSLVENLRDLCGLIPRLNFSNDPRLESLRQKIESELVAHTAQDLRDDYKVRESVAQAAEQIHASVLEFMQ